jgi:hypothetical protein
MALGYSTPLRNARLDAALAIIGSAAKIALYSGVRPATGGAVTTKLSENVAGSPFAPAAAGGVQTANAIADGTGLANGTATWGRLTTSGGTFVMDFSVTVVGGGGDLQLTGTAAIATGQTVKIASFAVTTGNA